jgi:membrane protease YdiL (CAAX protease family)
MGWIALVTLAAALLNGISLRPNPGNPWLTWLPLLVGYALLTVLAVARIRQQGRLRECFSLKGGDLSVGIILGLGLLAAAWLIKSRMVPGGSVREGWLLQIFSVTGPISGSTAQTLALLALVAMEEIVWRGSVSHELVEKLGARRALPTAATLYAMSLLPTAWTLRDPQAGLNPSLILAALGCGICWTFLALRSKRLFAVWASHAVFSYFAAAHLIAGRSGL